MTMRLQDWKQSLTASITVVVALAFQNRLHIEHFKRSPNRLSHHCVRVLHGHITLVLFGMQGDWRRASKHRPE